MIWRLSFNLGIFLSILFLPWQSVVLFLLAGFFYYDLYVEGVVWGFALDVVFGGGSSQNIWYTTYTLGCFIVTYFIKPYIRFYV